MDFSANKMPVKVIKEVAFAGTYFSESWKEFDPLKDIDQKFCEDD